MLHRVLALGLALTVLTVAQAEDSKLPKVGSKAPAIDLPATSIGSILPDKKEAKSLSLADLKGKNVVLFFYPRALTKGCTIESCGFRDKIEEFAKLDTVILGISTDTVALQDKFTQKEKLNFPLFADSEKSVTRAYGALNEKGFANRYTYVIDKKGVLRKIYTKVTPAKHPEEVLTYVKDNLTK
ncbi:MAG: peroxiredoxin [Gemmataceae bacterium]